jgi:16S rRNA C967 or C1407 C5-methylase (RsmB/RsmF family)
MGRKWSRKNKNKHSGEGKPRDNEKNPEWGKERDPYTVVKAGNFRMEAFYAYQGIHESRMATASEKSKEGDFVECSTAEEKEAERQLWLKTMKSSLPIAFRIGNDVDPDLRKGLISELEEFVGKKMKIEVEPKGGKRRLIREQEEQAKEDAKGQDKEVKDGEELPLPELKKEIKLISPAERLAFIPHAYQVSIDKQTLRRNSALKPFHDWLKIQTDAGFVTRQEAVSMIPPVVLDPKPHHIILDMAAAPGSKTSQLLEIVNLPTDKDCHEPKGCVVANDSDVKRAYMLVHQMRRINSPAVFITSCDARFFPLLRDNSNIESDPEGIFDRVLCDVPCTGDGTARKNPGVWKSWSALNGYALHPLQLAIALRGAQSTKVGGYLCYSTCSMNPIENEAVVAELLRLSEGSLELVERKSSMDNLASRPGMTSWTNLAESKSAREVKNFKKKNNAKMIARRKEWEEKNKQNEVETKATVEVQNGDEEKEVTEAPENKFSIKTEFKPESMGDREELKMLVKAAGMIEYSSHEEVPALMRKRIRRSCFPPTPEEISKFNLEYCMRILPQDMNTGGFFVALLKKVAPLNRRTKKRFEDLQKDIESKDAVPEKDPDSKKTDDDENGEPKLKKVKVEDSMVELDAKDVDMNGNGKIEEEKPNVIVDIAATEELAKDIKKDGRKNKTVVIDNFIPVPEDVFKPLKEFYGLNDESFDESNYMIRSAGDGKVLYFMTRTIKSLLIDRGIQDKVTVVSSGLKGFTRNNKDCEVGYRVAQEGVHFVAPHMRKRKISANLKDFEMCLSGPAVQIKDFSEEFAAKVRLQTVGSFVVTLEGYENDYIKKLIIVLWRCRSDSVNYLVTQTEIDGIKSKIRSIAKKNESEKKETGKES